MSVTRREAAEALGEVDQVQRTVRDRASYAIVGPILLVWGCVWLACFNITHFAPRWAGWGWIVGNMVGMAGTIVFGWLHPRARVVRGESFRRVSRRMFWSWLLLFVYADIWLAVLWPWRGEQLGVFGVSLIMFAYVLMGIWFEMRVMLWLGITVTVLACAGYAVNMLVPGYLNLTLAATGGLGLLGAGAYLCRYWRRGRG